MASYPEFQALNRFHLPVIRAMEISLRGANMRMTHERLNRSKIISFIQESSGEGMTDCDGSESGFICPQITCLLDNHFRNFTH